MHVEFYTQVGSVKKYNAYPEKSVSLLVNNESGGDFFYVVDQVRKVPLKVTKEEFNKVRIQLGLRDVIDFEDEDDTSPVADDAGKNTDGTLDLDHAGG